MANLLETGAAWLADQLKSYASQQVVYQRGADEVVIAATIGRTVGEFDNGAGIIERYEARDWLIQAADLVLGGIATLPQAGDRIRETAGGSELVYEVMAFGNEPPWRYSDPFRRLLRIHTKQIG